MTLKDDCGSIFVSGGGGYAEYNVAYGIGFGCDAVLLGKVKKICSNLFLLLGGTGDTCNLVKNREHCLGLQIFDFHISELMLKRVSLSIKNA